MLVAAVLALRRLTTVPVVAVLVVLRGTERGDTGGGVGGVKMAVWLVVMALVPDYWRCG